MILIGSVIEPRLIGKVMRTGVVFFLGVAVCCGRICHSQPTQSQIPDAPPPSVNLPERPAYAPPTQGERFKTYVSHTYGWTSIVEAAAHGGIAQTRDNPSQWPQGAEGYGYRVGSATGEIVVRATTEYAIADLFREDLRPLRCVHPCSGSRFKVALDNSFLARRGDDGHEAISVARIIGPFSSSTVAVNTWYPGGSGRANVAREAGLQFGLIYIRNLLRVSLTR